VFGIPAVVSLFAHLFGVYLCRIADPQLKVQLCQQALKPTRMSRGFDPQAHAGPLSLEFPVELLGLDAMR